MKFNSAPTSSDLASLLIPSMLPDKTLMSIMPVFMALPEYFQLTPPAPLSPFELYKSSRLYDLHRNTLAFHNKKLLNLATLKHVVGSLTKPRNCTFFKKSFFHMARFKTFKFSL